MKAITTYVRESHMLSSSRTALGRRILPVVLVGVAGLALASCSGGQPGVAATVGDETITEQQLDAQVSNSLQAQGKAPDSADATVVSTALRQMVVTKLVDMLSERAGITVSQSQIDQSVMSAENNAGGKEQLQTMLAAQGVTPDEVDDVVTLNIEAQQLGAALAPTGSSDQQVQALYAALAKFSDDIGVTVSPRFGTWDPAQLVVGPSLSDVATLPTAN